MAARGAASVGAGAGANSGTGTAANTGARTASGTRAVTGAGIPAVKNAWSAGKPAASLSGAADKAKSVAADKAKSATADKFELATDKSKSVITDKSKSAITDKSKSATTAAIAHNAEAQHDRLGLSVRVHTVDGHVYEGIFHGATTDRECQGLGVSLKRARLLDPETMRAKEGGEVVQTLVVRGADVGQLVALDVDVDFACGGSNGSASVVAMSDGSRAFRTDTGISGNAGPLHERELQKWEAGEGEDALGAGLEEDGTAWSGRGHGTSTKNWDQFEANEKLFGVTVDFDEDQYTTKLDKSSLEYKRRERFAERKAKEIMSGATGNVHVAEERGRMVVDDSQMDEEDRYGAVVRTPGAYVPPHGRRAGTGVAARATTTGVPSTAKAIATGVPSTVKPDTNKKSWAAVSAATANAHVAVATKSPSTASPGKPSSNGANIPAAGPAKPEVKAPSDEKKTVAAVVEKSAPAPSAKKAVTEKPVVTTPAMASSEKKPTGLNVQAASFSFNTGAAAFKPATPDVAQPAVAPPKAKLSTANVFGKPVPEGTLSVAATVQENLKKSARRADANTELESPVWPYGQQQSYSAQMGSMPHSAGHAPDEYHAQMAAAAAMAAAGMAPMMPPGGQHFYMPQPFFPPPNFGFPPLPGFMPPYMPGQFMPGFAMPAPPYGYPPPGMPIPVPSTAYPPQSPMVPHSDGRNADGD